MNKYDILKEKHQKRINALPLKFAFSNEQFKEAMQELGLTENDTDKIISIGCSGFIRKTDKKLVEETFKENKKELEQAIKEDSTGNDFIKDMFYSELVNHEFGYTEELEETLEALGYTITQVNDNKALKNGLDLAIKEVLDNE
jgi:hypothetical protein